MGFAKAQPILRALGILGQISARRCAFHPAPRKRRGTARSAVEGRRPQSRRNGDVVRSSCGYNDMDQSMSTARSARSIRSAKSYVVQGAIPVQQRTNLDIVRTALSEHRVTYSCHFHRHKHLPSNASQRSKKDQGQKNKEGFWYGYVARSGGHYFLVGQLDVDRRTRSWCPGHVRNCSVWQCSGCKFKAGAECLRRASRHSRAEIRAIT